MNKTRNIFILVVLFILFGLITIFFTHKITQPEESLVSQENYINYIKIWTDSVGLDQSLANISSVKNNFLNLKSNDRSIGQAHIALFLAFDAWERFLTTGQLDDREQAISHFSSAAVLLPEFSGDIENLEDILKQQNA